MLRCKLKRVVTRITRGITTHLEPCYATKLRCCKLKQLSMLQVELAFTFFNKFLQLAYNNEILLCNNL